jgi:hypothetical protein
MGWELPMRLPASRPDVSVLPETFNPHNFALLQKLGVELIEFGIASDVRQEKVEELS